MHNEAPIEEVQRELLRVLDWFHNFAEENKIDYFLDAGALLGLVRTGTMIPWDDDIDLGILREDFIRLVPLLEKAELPSGVEFHHAKSKNPMDNNVFSGKLRLKAFQGEETHRAEIGLRYSLSHSGPAVDLVPFDYIPEQKLSAAFRINLSRAISQLQLVKTIDLEKNGLATKYRMSRFAARFIPSSLSSILLKLVPKLRTRSRTSTLYPSLGDLYAPCQYKVDQIYPTQVAKLKGIPVRIPAIPTHVLFELYGSNFMTPPAASNQRGHFASLRRVVD